MGWQRKRPFIYMGLAIIAIAILSVSVPIQNGVDRPTSYTGPEQRTQMSDSKVSGSETEGRAGVPQWLSNGTAIVLACSAALVMMYLWRGSTDGDSPQTTTDKNSDDGGTNVETTAKPRMDTAGYRRNDDDPFDNEVYRTWYEMIRASGIRDPHSETPCRFAELAVRAGFDPTTVEETTNLFTKIRYGGREPTESEKQRAVEIRRRLFDITSE